MMGHELDRLLSSALSEDAPNGDRTTEAISLSGPARGDMVAKEPLIVCGLPAALRTFTLADPSCGFESLKAEGEEVPAGTALAAVKGPWPALLLAERASLNLLQRLCGIATQTRAVVRSLEGTAARVCDTRKTTPGLRALEKYAVRTGGGTNHRMGLSDAILIKDNHIAAAGSIALAVRRARESAGALWRIEVEVSSVEGLLEAAAAGADVVLLDNMDDASIAEAVRVRPRGILLEASGGMTLDRAARVAALGVDLISMGMLTHSVRASDISFKIRPPAQP